ncbi:MAG: ABC transporter ATP-binding protein [Corynebacteriales bacterium]|nr:ABC transporter ATP-binding protein [Mycobacteriales bacterium]
MVTAHQWGAQMRDRLIDCGMEASEALKLTDEFLAEAQSAGQDPAELYGPAVSYATAIAQSIRVNLTRTAPLQQTRGEVVLRLRQVTKRYRRRVALQEVDLTLHAGEIAAVVGANGSGKSTLMNICAGIIRATSGTVERTPRVGYAPQSHGVSPLLTAAEHFELFGAIHGMRGRRSQSIGNQLSRHLGWSPRPGVLAGHLSGGTQQKLNVVLSELNRPDLILLDEPYQGFDQESYLDFWEQVFAWREAGAGVLVVTHLLHDVERVDHVLELRKGDES